MALMRRFGVGVCVAALVLALILALAWGARTWLAGEAARLWLGAHGLEARVRIETLDFSGLTGRLSLGPPETPIFSVAHLDVRFAPGRWIPQIAAVTLVDPVVRARVEVDGRVVLGGLDPLIGAGGASGPSPYVSRDLTVSVSGLRAYLATPAGQLEVDGAAKLAGGAPVELALAAKPAAIAYGNIRMRLDGARVGYTRASGHLSVQLAGSVASGALTAQELNAGLEADGLAWHMRDGGLAVSAAHAHLTAKARRIVAGTVLDQPSLDVVLAGLSAGADTALTVDADITAKAGGGLAPHLPALGDAALGRALARNLTRLAVALRGHLHHGNGETAFVAEGPVTVTGADGATLTVPALALKKEHDGMQVRFTAALDGKGLPRVIVRDAALTWRDGALTGDLGAAARFNYAMLRGARIQGQARLSWKAGNYALTLQGCAPVHLAQFRPAKVMAENISASLCPRADTPLLRGGKDGWHFEAQAGGVAADLTLAGVHLDRGAADLDFRGQAGTETGAGPQGQVHITAGRIQDKTQPVRFHPVTGAGTLTLRNGVWQGTLDIKGKGDAALADVAVTHVMASGRGHAVIAAPHLAFAPGAFQPSDLSPLLAAFRQADGTAAFQGRVNWDHQGLTSGGTLTVDGLNFLTPLGQAHAVKSEIKFASLLPPVTEPGQALSISRIDWTLPFTGVSLRFGFGPKAITVDSLKAGFAEGQARLGTVTIALGSAGDIHGAVNLDSIALSPLIAASNLGSKLTLNGKVSGRIPFVAGADGIHIHDGHVAADGPGTLSINPALWTQNTTATNAVQGFAYQALEHLAFDQLSAELNSVDGGRLQMVFHIKGQFAPPKPQTASVPLMGLLNGTALKKPIPLPSGTPIDLTLDTSLNFDELLKSYVQAWSNTLGSAQESHSGGNSTRGSQ